MEEKRNKNCKFTIEQEKQIVQEYVSGDSAQKIADKWNYNANSVLKIVKFVCGNRPFLEEMGEYLGVKYHIKPDRSIFDLCYNTKESAYLEKRLYKNATVFLDRKYELAKRSFNSPITLEDVMKKS